MMYLLLSNGPQYNKQITLYCAETLTRTLHPYRDEKGGYVGTWERYTLTGGNLADELDNNGSKSFCEVVKFEMPQLLFGR